VSAPARPDLTPVASLAELRALVAGEPAVLAYFSTPGCRVCQALRPKVAALLASELPRLRGVYVDCAALPEAAGQYGVFAVPTLVAFFEGREWMRHGRGVGIGELHGALARPYALCFPEQSETEE
jgi:thioredoxin 1